MSECLQGHRGIGDRFLHNVTTGCGERLIRHRRLKVCRLELPLVTRMGSESSLFSIRRLPEGAKGGEHESIFRREGYLLSQGATRGSESFRSVDMPSLASWSKRIVLQSSFLAATAH